MTRGTELSAAIEAQLQVINQANGYATQLRGVYGFAERKPDKAPLPYLLVRIVEDELLRMVGTKAARAVRYEIEGCMPRSATLRDLQLLHHDILVSLGTGQLPHVTALDSGRVFEESAEYVADQDGSTTISVISTVSLQYVETY